MHTFLHAGYVFLELVCSSFSRAFRQNEICGHFYEDLCAHSSCLQRPVKYSLAPVQRHHPYLWMHVTSVENYSYSNTAVRGYLTEQWNERSETVAPK